MANFWSVCIPKIYINLYPPEVRPRNAQKLFPLMHFLVALFNATATVHTKWKNN